MCGKALPFRTSGGIAARDYVVTIFLLCCHLLHHQLKRGARVCVCAANDNDLIACAAHERCAPGRVPGCLRWDALVKCRTRTLPQCAVGAEELFGVCCVI